MNLKPRYFLASLSPEQLVNAALDFETVPLPSRVPAPLALPAVATTPNAARVLIVPAPPVAWRSPLVPWPKRVEAARRLLISHAPALDALAAAGFHALPPLHRRHMIAALRARPAGVLRLLRELDAAGVRLAPFLAHTIKRLNTAA